MKQIFTSLLIFICFGNISAQWQVTTGPAQPNVLAISISGTNMFAAAGSAVSLTSNNGANWGLANNGLAGSIYCLASKGSDIFAGAGGGAVFQSSNNGTNWTNTSTGLPSYDVRSITVNGNDIYAGTWGVYKSSNSGLLWSKISNGWNAMVTSIAVSGNTILAGTTTGIYMSPDNGANWNAINTGLGTQVNAILIYGTTFLAGTNFGLYISTNNGANWSITNVTDAVSSFAVKGTSIFAGSESAGGVFQSTNGGASWTAINAGLTNLTVYSLATNSNYLFAGTTGYVWKRLFSEIISLTITTTSNPTIGGTTIGGGSYPYGATDTVSATANIGYTFTSWKENGNIVSTDSHYIFSISANRNLVAEFSQTTSIQEDKLSNAAISIYPNPAISQLFIQSSTEIQQVNIYNTTGSLVMAAQPQTANCKLETVNLSTGVYIAEIKTKEGSVRKRWVKIN